MHLKDIIKILTDSGIEPNEAKIEAQMLVEHYSGLSSTALIIGKTPSSEQWQIIEQKAQLRARTHQPIQYITGVADFMGEKFIVTPEVLIPRDETELLVRNTVDLINKNDFHQILDMCSGSGCITCMIAKLTKAIVLGVDISLDALHVAISNMEKMELFNRATFRKSDIFSKIREDEKFDIIVSNPPYVAPKFKQNIQEEVSFEPELALYTNDSEGLEFYEKITHDAPKFLNNNGYLLFELGIEQSASVKNIMLKYGFCDIQIIKDLANIDRVIIAKYKE